MGIKHKKHSPRNDTADSTIVQPSDWNEEHEIDGMLGALSGLDATPGTFPYVKPNGDPSVAKLTEFGRDLISLATADDILLALGIGDRLRDVVSVLDYAVSRSQRTAIRNGDVGIETVWGDAVADASARGVGTILIPAGNFTSSSAALSNPGVVVRGEYGKTVITKYGDGNVFQTHNAPPEVSGGLIGLDALVGSVSVVMQSGLGASYAVGQTCVIISETAIDAGQPSKKAEFVDILGVSGDTITFWQPLKDSYLVAATARLLPVSLTDGVAYSDVAFVMDSSLTGLSTTYAERSAIDLRFCRRPLVQGVRVKGPIATGVQLIGCRGALISDYRAYDGGSATTGTSSPESSEGASGFGYGIGEGNLNEGLIVDRLYAERLRHAYTTYGLVAAYGWSYGCPRNSLISNSQHISPKNAGFDTHQTGDGITFSNCHTIGGHFVGFQIRSRATRVLGCSATDTIGAGAWIRGGYSGSTGTCGDRSEVSNFSAVRTNSGVTFDGTDYREYGAIVDDARETILRGISAREVGGPIVTTGRNGVGGNLEYRDLHGKDICQRTVTKPFAVDLRNMNFGLSADISEVRVIDTSSLVTDIVKIGAANNNFISLKNVRGVGNTGLEVSAVSGAIVDYEGSQLITGRLYATRTGTVISTVAIPGADTIYLYPFYVDHARKVTSGSGRVVTGGAGSSIKAAVWRNSALSNRPLGSPVLVDNAGASTATNNSNAVLAFFGFLPTGWYWMGVKCTGAPPTMLSIPSADQFMAAFMGAASLAANALSVASTYNNAMPAFAEGAAFTEFVGNGAPIINLGL
ncbi:hypothetical protein LPW26_06150 [Rhodopseudomonas sp. HC1]|uniref:hypothetical protein n=1 Tax=Rhodopseudomonas infernalis TaxID=2897386 RepID=UPI001EE9633B|nr:hypothetical protein [Rhodopseudomonas infernalis]MCG6204209.1 hypothetical protein [Rhodopseudomonas infernalis]